MIKVVRIALLCTALTCGTAWIASAQWYPPVVDPHGTYRIPGTDEFVTGGGKVEFNSSRNVQQNTQPAATQKARRAVVQRNAPHGGCANLEGSAPQELERIGKRI